MANDAQWVDDVRRWYFGGHPPAGELAADGSDGSDELAIGYEAANPALQGCLRREALRPGDL